MTRWKLCAAYGADETAFVIGDDKLEELPRWAHAQELVKKYGFVVVNYDKGHVGDDSETAAVSLLWS